MNVFDAHDDMSDNELADVVAAVVDERGTVTQWSRAASQLLDLQAEDVCGQPLSLLFAPGRTSASAGAAPDASVLLRHANGHNIAVRCRLLKLEGSANRLFIAVPADRAVEAEQGAALLRALMAQDRIGVVVRDLDLTVRRTNLTSVGQLVLPLSSRLGDVMAASDAALAEERLRSVLSTGVPQVAEEQHVRSLSSPGREWSFSVSALRTTDRSGRSTGVTVLLTDATAQWLAARRLRLRHRAAVAVGHSLDPRRIAQDIADVLVPGLGNLVSVDLAEAVLSGDEPPKAFGGGDLHLTRIAVRAEGGWPADALQPGATVPPLRDHPSVRRLQAGETVLVDRTTMERGLDPHRAALIIPDGAHYLAAAPLFARGLVLGVIALWRTRREEPFDERDADLLTEIALQAGLGVDNARRYTREHRAAVELQRRLLPAAAIRTSALETASRYLPAAGGAEIGGDWFDAIPLPSLRVALVVGDVIGHGLHAAATMGRLRTAVQTLADMELAPDELLGRLDGLVARLAAEAAPADRDTVGATCLVALYDPVTQQCAIASAGHPPPIVTRPQEGSEPVQLRPGPPLGVGGLPFETTTVHLAPGSWLTLYTDGLLDRTLAIDAAIRHLGQRVDELHRSGCSVDQAGHSLTAHHPRLRAADDTALLLAHVRSLRDDAIAQWEFPADPATVAETRTAVLAKITEWGLDDIAFTAELIVSELVTNAIRYAGGPVGLRLIRDNVLICEVSDPSNTQPRLRRASPGDEGGRGLFLVAQLSDRWGSRYQQSGKTIWAELNLAM
ncbi:SpoIIE family protein phosphatase [Streptomyces sp. NPDC056296]|uniref:ATP-binding SpoIIE family protein phosphatase n=1 Tax=Streptomyces sp. NPDC056296 TaxID=3345775 RepID=UPI0035DADD2E